MAIFKKKKSKSATKDQQTTTKKAAPAKKTPTAKPAAKKSTPAKKPAKSKKEPTNIYYVTAREEKGKKVGWEVKRGGASKITALVDTKDEALDKVRELARNSEATVMIYRADGELQDTLKFGKKKK